MFQSYALFPHMSVAANVGYGLKMRRIAKSEIARRVAEALALIKLEGLEDRKPRQLSGGQQQRVALARALVIRPKVLLLDEPFSALDRNLRASMQVELKEIQRKLGVTTIFVTHDQSEALSLSDRIAVIAEGRIRQLGTAGRDLSPAGRPLRRFVRRRRQRAARAPRARRRSDCDGRARSGAGAGAVRARCKAPQPAPMVDLFVRPEELRVAEHGTAVAVHGIVAAQIYQGGHVDLYVDVPEAVIGTRAAARARTRRHVAWRAGARVNIALATDKAIAFRPATNEAG